MAHGSHFSFIVDDEWVGEIDDEVLPAGGIGFAAQTFSGAPEGIFRLRRLSVDSRPMEVEREHLRWTYFFPVSPQARVRLARTLFQMGSFSASVVQLRRALKNREGTAEEHFLLAESYARLSLVPDALAEIDTVIRLEPGHREARLEKPNLLYLSNRLLEARDELRALLADEAISVGPVTWNMLGNAEYSLGNWAKASEAYLRACELQPGVPQFLSNAARSREKRGPPRGGEGSLPERRPRPVCRGDFRRAFPPSPPAQRAGPGERRGALPRGKDALPRRKDR